jgi:hypothetical protein
MLDELSGIGYIGLGAGADGKRYGCVVNFLKHQRIDRPKPSIIKGIITFDDQSTSHRRAVVEPSRLNGMEWNGMEGKGNTPNPLKGALLVDPTPEDSSPATPAAGPDTPNPAEEAHEPVTEPLATAPAKKQAKPKRASDAGPETVPIPLELNTPEFRTAWAEWIAERAKTKKPMTDTAAHRQLAQLTPFGPAWAVARIDQAIIRRWTGLVFSDDSRELRNRLAMPRRADAKAANDPAPDIPPDAAAAAAQHWPEIHAAFRRILNDEEYNETIAGIECLGLQDHTAWLGVPDEITKNFIDVSYYGHRLADAMREVMGWKGGMEFKISILEKAAF